MEDNLELGVYLNSLCNAVAILITSYKSRCKPRFPTVMSIGWTVPHTVKRAGNCRVLCSGGLIDCPVDVEHRLQQSTFSNFFKGPPLWGRHTGLEYLFPPRFFRLFGEISIHGGANLNWRLVGVYFCYSVQSSRKVVPIDSYSRMRKNWLDACFLACFLIERGEPPRECKCQSRVSGRIAQLVRAHRW